MKKISIKILYSKKLAFINQNFTQLIFFVFLLIKYVINIKIKSIIYAI